MDRNLVEHVGPGRVIRVDGRISRFVRFTQDQGDLRAVVEFPDESTLTMPFAEFCTHTTTITKPTTVDGLDVADMVEWNQLPEPARAHVIDLARDLLEIRTGSRRGTPELDRDAGVLNPAYDPQLTSQDDRVRLKAAERLSKGLRPSSRSGLLRRLRDFGTGDLTALVHKNRRPVTNATTLPPEAMVVLRDFLAGRQDEARVPDSVLASMARAELVTRGHDIQMGAATWARTVGEAARGLGLHRPARSQLNRRDTPGVAFGRLTVSRPGELIHIDATPSNTHCWFPTIGWARVTILTAIDVYDRDIVALRVVPGAVTSREVSLLLWDIGRPNITKAGWPFERVSWHGVPRLANIVAGPDAQVRINPAEQIGTKAARTPTTVVLDFGAENRSLHLMSAAARNGIGIIYCPPGAPHTKGIVEAWHNSLDAAQAALPGYKGANPLNHPRLAELGSVLTAGDLHDALWTWVLTVYRHRPHAGLFDPANPGLESSPADIYERYLTHGGAISFPTDPWRMLDFLSNKTLLLQDYGLNLHYRHYNSDALQDLRCTIQRGPGARAVKLTVFYDRSDISRVYLKHPVDQTWMMIPRTDPDRLTMPPCTEILHHAAVVQALRGDRRSLTASEVQLAEMKLYLEWSKGTFEDRKAQRMAALEATRAAMHAHDLESATDEYVSLAYPTFTSEGPPELGADDLDDAVLSYDDVAIDGFAQ